jgi:hypothetical protein
MLAVGLIAVLLGLLRTSAGPAIAIGTGCIIGCYLAPFLAHRGMRKLDGALAGLPQTDPRALRRPILVAQAYVMILFGWIFAGAVTAALGVLIARQFAR